MEPHPVHEDEQEEGLSLNVYVRCINYGFEKKSLVWRTEVFGESSKKAANVFIDLWLVL